MDPAQVFDGDEFDVAMRIAGERRLRQMMDEARARG